MSVRVVRPPAFVEVQTVGSPGRPAFTTQIGMDATGEWVTLTTYDVAVPSRVDISLPFAELREALCRLEEIT